MGIFKDGVRAKLQKVAAQANKDHAKLLLEWGAALQQYAALSRQLEQESAQLDALINAYPGGVAGYAQDSNDANDLSDDRQAADRTIRTASISVQSTIGQIEALFRKVPNGVAGITGQLEMLRDKEARAMAALNEYAEDKAKKQKELTNPEYKAWKAQYTNILNSLK